LSDPLEERIPKAKSSMVAAAISQNLYPYYHGIRNASIDGKSFSLKLHLTLSLLIDKKYRGERDSVAI